MSDIRDRQPQRGIDVDLLTDMLDSLSKRSEVSLDYDTLEAPPPAVKEFWGDGTRKEALRAGTYLFNHLDFRYLYCASVYVGEEMKHLTGSKDEPPLDAETLLQSLKENHATTLITLVRTHPTEIDDSVSERMGMEEARLKDVEKTCQAVSLVGDPELDDAVKAQWNALSDHRSCLLKAEQHWKNIRGMAYLPLPVVRDMGNVERNTERWLMEFCLAGMRDEKKEAMNPPPDHTGTEDTSPGLTKPLSSMAVETDLASTAKADGADDESLAFLQFREAYRRLRARVEEQDRRLSSSILQPEEASSLAFKCLTSVANHVPQSHKEAWRSSLDDLTEFQSILDEVGLVPRMKDVVSGNGKLQESLRSLAGRLPVILDQLDKVYSVKQATENGSLNTIIHALKIGFDEADEAALGFYKNSHEILTAYTTLQNLSSRLHSVTGVGQQGRNHQPPTEAGPSSQTPGKPGRLRRT